MLIQAQQCNSSSCADPGIFMQNSDIFNVPVSSLSGGLRMLQSDDERALFALPARLGGLAFTNPVEVADTEYSHSLLANRHLADSILRQHVTYISNHENIKATSNAISHANNTKYEKIQAHLKASLPPCIIYIYKYKI